MPFSDSVKRVWRAVTRALTLFGEFISTAVLTIFYYTIFALVAIPYRLFERPFDPASDASNFRPPNRTFAARGDFEQEF